jgi:hypothetical protein
LCCFVAACLCFMPPLYHALEVVRLRHGLYRALFLSSPLPSYIALA